MTSLLWLRRDLRLHDHPALRAALDGDGPVVPVFCFDEGLLKGRHASGPRTQFLLECLADLDASLRSEAAACSFGTDRPSVSFPPLARELGATRVHYTLDVSPFARARQSAVSGALEQAGVEAVAHPGLFAVDQLEPIRTGSGDPYTVFTPFFRNWLGQPRRPVLGAPRKLPAAEPAGQPRNAAHSSPTWGSAQECHEPRAWRGAGRPRGPAPVSRRAGRDYGEGRDVLTGESVSRLSPYLHFGCRLAAGDRGAPARRRGCGCLSASAVLA